MVLGVPVVGDDARLEKVRREGIDHVAVALGDNALRQSLGDRAVQLGFALATAVSTRTSISPTARLGEGVVVLAGAVVNADAVVERLAIVNSGAVVEHDVRLGAAAHLGPGGILAGGVEVGERAFVGAGATVIPGVKIGRDARIGAGDCVVDGIPAGVLALGVPARVAKPLEASS
jgi:UDP-perosamine 4-acetyltransferase